MIIDKIREFILTCPLLDGTDVNVNCLGGNAVCFSVEQVAAEPVVKKYCDGGTLRQCRFVLAVRDSYDEITDFNVEAARLMEKIEAWVEEQNSVGNLPKPEDEKIVPESMEITASCSVSDSTADTARLQTEMRFLYRREK